MEHPESFILGLVAICVEDALVALFPWVHKYPLPCKVVKVLLCLLHGNTNCRKGLSVNKHLLDGHSSLSIASIDGMHALTTLMEMQ